MRSIAGSSFQRYGSRVVSNDYSGRCVDLLLHESASALRPANAAFVNRRVTPYLISQGTAFALL